MVSFVIIVVILAALVTYGAIEFRRHQRLVYRIPIRIHVNGTRGKSSVTRLIGAGLRAGGINTIVKVTGTYPRLIMNDGSEAAIHRKEKANILEQLKIVRFAVENQAEALVIECMALQPIYQRITETKMVHATVGVITNIRLDHLDVMGPGLMDVADALSYTIPHHQYMFTAEDRIYDYLEKKAGEKNCTPLQTDPDSVTDAEMEAFHYIEHKENVALALAICGHLGVERTTALHGMYTAIPDEGVLTRTRIERDGKRVLFYNAFAANDPESSLTIWRKVIRSSQKDYLRIIMLNTREDRLDRARQLTDMSGRLLDMDYIILIGQRAEVVEGMALKNKIPRNKIINIGWTSPAKVFDRVMDLTEINAIVVAIGNMGGMGGPVVKYFEEMSHNPVEI